MVSSYNRYIIHYSTSHLSSKDLVRFFYRLKGRGKSGGLLEKTNSKYLVKSVVEVPAKEVDNWKYFLDKWLCDYEIIKVVPKSEANYRLFLFKSSNLTGSEKVRFFYALKGRGNKKGILEKTSSEYIAKSTVLVSVENYFEVVKFFKKWNCEFKIKELALNEN